MWQQSWDPGRVAGVCDLLVRTLLAFMARNPNLKEKGGMGFIGLVHPRKACPWQQASLLTALPCSTDPQIMMKVIGSP